MAMTKREELESPNSCLNKAAEDEGVFVLRMKDELAAQTVRHWAGLAEAMGTSPEKVAEARAWAEAAERFPGRKVPT